jgi:hypothetical protein
LSYRASSAAEILVTLETGGQNPLVTSNEPVFIDPVIASPALSFSFGFASDEAVKPSVFFDSFSVLLFDPASGLTAIFVTVDTAKVNWAPGIPGTIVLSPESITRNEIAYPATIRALAKSFAYEVVLPIPPAFKGLTPNVRFDLFDSKNGVNSLAWYSKAIHVTGIGDNLPPVAVCRDITIQLDASGSASISATQVDNGSSDNVGIGSMEVTPNSFNCSNLGSNTVTLKVTDTNGNTALCPAIVIVQDTMAPSITAYPANFSATVSSNCGYELGDLTSQLVALDNCTVPAKLQISQQPPAGTMLEHGTHTILFAVSDESGNTSHHTTKATVYLTTSLTVAPATVQCSDHAVLSAALKTCLGTPLASALVKFEVGGAVAGTSITDANGVANLVYAPDPGIGLRTIVASTLEDDARLLRTASGQSILTVKTEDTTVSYPDKNPLSVRVATDGGNSPAFDLAVNVSETFPDVAGSDSSGGSLAAPGDINLAAVTISLVPVGSGSSYTKICDVRSVSGIGYDAKLTASCTFSDIQVNTYLVEVRVDGTCYSGETIAVLTVYDPSLGFTTGGGFFYWPGSEDLLKDYPGDHCNFGFTVQHNKRGGNVRGSLLLVRRQADGSKYRVKSSTLDGLALGTSEENGVIYGKASLSGKCTYIEPGWIEPIGNYEFAAYVEDRNEPGTGTDRFWIQIRDKARLIVPPISMSMPGAVNAVRISGGNIQVPHNPDK